MTVAGNSVTMKRNGERKRKRKKLREIETSECSSSSLVIVVVVFNGLERKSRLHHPSANVNVNTT